MQRIVQYYCFCSSINRKMSYYKVVDINIPVPWGNILGKTFGEEKAIPVLCVHGRTDNLESFSQLMPLLPRNHYYVCIDLPGHGKSSHPHKGYILDLVWHAFCVKRVIDHFKWSKLYFLGHSLGGQIGFLIAALYQELVLKLIVIDTLMYVHVPPPNTAVALRDFVFDPLLKLENRTSLDQAPAYTIAEFVQKMKESRRTEVKDEQITAMAERNLVKVGENKYKYSNDQRTKILGPIHFTFDQLESIANEICCPTMVILGKNSLSTKPHDRLSRTPLQKNINATFHVIEGDHDVHLARSHQVARLISSFLTEETNSKL